MIQLLLLLLPVLAQYGVNFDKASYTVSDTMVVTWDGTYSSVDLSKQDIGSLLLCTCNSTSLFNCTMLQDNIPVLTESSLKIPISEIQTMGPDGQYMLQMATRSTTSKAYTLAYSNGFFTLSGMTGKGTANKNCNIPYAAAFFFPNTASTSSVSWTSWTVPTEYANSPSYMIPYSLQGGPTRYAPPQPTPGTKITQTVTPSRRFPTSSVSLRTTYLFNKYLPVTTTTQTGLPYTQYPNYVSSIQTTPAGYKPSAGVASIGVKRGKKRWAENIRITNERQTNDK